MKNLHIIWNLSGECPYSCAFCCTGSSSAAKLLGGKPDSDRADLNLHQKLAIVENLKGISAYIDFSGGDPLQTDDDRRVIAHASAFFGRENVGVTTTGRTLSRLDEGSVVDLVGNIDITYDFPYAIPHSHRPDGYNCENLQQGTRFSMLGLIVKAQVVMTPYLLAPAVVERLLDDLATSRIEKMEIMRFMPVGRGVTEDLLSVSYISDLLEALLHGIDRRCTRLSCSVQCALRGLDGNVASACSMLERKLGIDRFGNLFACAWAGSIDTPLQQNPFYLGSLRRASVLELLDSQRAHSIRDRLSENQPHCKVFAYHYGGKTAEACFIKSDPLYSLNDADK